MSWPMASLVICYLVSVFMTFNAGCPRTTTPKMTSNTRTLPSRLHSCAQFTLAFCNNILSTRSVPQIAEQLLVQEIRISRTHAQWWSLLRRVQWSCKSLSARVHGFPIVSRGLQVTINNDQLGLEHQLRATRGGWITFNTKHRPSVRTGVLEASIVRAKTNVQQANSTPTSRKTKFRTKHEVDSNEQC